MEDSSDGPFIIDFDEDEIEINRILKSVEERKITLGKRVKVTGTPHKELMLDVPVRWSTSLGTMERGKDGAPLECTINTLHELTAFKLYHEDWDLIFQ
ncbi:unnamed protein product, partial [Allacma fusca]